ncbi:MAG: DUF4347 domain-containing protein, partial [Phormidesmis sp.]
MTTFSKTSFTDESSVLFVDENVEEASVLLQGLKPGVVVCRLNTQTDGVHQITQFLQRRYSEGQPIDQIHILSHGSAGCVYLGHTELSPSTLELYGEQLVAWFSPFSHTDAVYAAPSLFLYGCNVAAGELGSEFLISLHTLTRASIYASTTLTGNAAQGGDWDLDTCMSLQAACETAQPLSSHSSLAMQAFHETPLATASTTAAIYPSSSKPMNANQLFSADALANFPGTLSPDGGGFEPAPDIEKTEASSRQELVVVDAGVEDKEALIADFESRGVEYVVLDGDGDGVSQITEVLANRSGLDALHIISHGSQGQAHLGNAVLSADTIDGYSDELADWGEALGAEGDILFYGCDLADGPGGASFVNEISALTGADVAASNDLTGAAHLGGDFDLEVKAGAIEADIALSAAAQASFAQVLIDTDGDSVDDTIDLDDDNDGILDTVENEPQIVPGQSPGFGLLPTILTSISSPLVVTTDPLGVPLAAGVTFDAPTNLNGSTLATMTAQEIPLLGATMTFSSTPGFLRNDTGVSQTMSFASAQTVRFSAGGLFNPSLVTQNESFTFTALGAPTGFEWIVNSSGNADITVSGNSITVTGNNVLFDADFDIFASVPITGVEVTLERDGGLPVVPEFGVVFVEFDASVITNADTDTDGIPDYLDLDSDNDGIPDNVEAQATDSYIAPNNDAGTGNQGVDSAYTGGLSPVNTDSTDNPDYLDTDSDNEGGDDETESGNVSAGETYADPNGSLDTGAAGLPDGDSDSEADFRDATITAPTLAPGGVSAGLRLWTKADAGTGTTTDGTAINTWSDQSGNSNDVAVTAAGREPTYSTGNAGSNYNPTVVFDGLNDGLELAPFMTGAEAGGSVFGAAANNTPGLGFDNLVVFGIDNPHLGTNSGNGAQLVWMNGSSPINDTHPTLPQAGQTHVWSWEWDMASNPSSIFSNTGVDIVLDGEVFNAPDLEIRESSFADGGLATDQFQIGSWEAVEVWDGPIGEVVVYDRNLTAAESQRVNSYISLKWGTTLDNDPASGTVNYDYVDSNGTTIWAGTSNAAYQTYHNDIAGIGRDDASALDQQKSNSVNSDSVVTIENSSGAFTADNSFLTWGNNDQTATFATDYTPTTFTPPAGYYRMDRVWKVQETGTVNTVTVSHDTAEHLLVSNDPTFATGVNEIALVGGNATVDFTDGQYFTFGTNATAPGGVAGNLTMWLRGGAGTGTTTDGAAISTWQDQSLNGNDESQATASLQPEYVADSGLFNFNSSVRFDSDRLQTDLTNTNPWDSNDGTVYVIYNQEQDGAWRNLLDFGTSSFDSNNPQLGFTPSDVVGTFDDFGGGQDDSSFAVVSGETRIAGYDWTYNTFGEKSFHFDGQVESGGTFDKIGPSIGNFVNIGGDPQLGEYFQGQIAEVVVYQERHDAAERQRVNTYLALKYGVTLDTTDNEATIEEGDYVLADGTTVVWDTSANSAYHSDVAGIGRDDAGSLDQQKSKSVNSDGVVTIDNGGAFTTDESFLVWGNNDGSVALNANYDGGTNNRLGRVWKVQETGSVDNALVQISTATAAGLQSIIIHSSDPNFGTVDRVVELTTNGANYEATVDFNDGDFFTFSTEPAVALTDTDGDGVPDATDIDDDNDGIIDTNEGNGALDTDNDGIVDSLDLDSDNDGINDVIEANGVDIDGDGQYDPSFTSVPNPSLSVNLVGSSGGIDASNLTSQGQVGHRNFQNNALPSAPGTAVVYEEDTLTLTQALAIDYRVPDPSTGSVTVSQLGTLDRIPPGTEVKSYLVHFDAPNTAAAVGSLTFDQPIAAIIGMRSSGVGDKLNASNYLANGDSNLWYNGSFRVAEFNDALTISSDRRTLDFNLVNFGAYVDQFRIIFAETPGTLTVPADTNQNGLYDNLEPGGLAFVDTDSDSVPDYRDLDSDNDSVSDLIEGGNGGVDSDNNGVVDGPDSDGDGIQDSVDGNDNFYGDLNDPNPTDSDRDGIGDFREIDSNNDGTNDIVEQGFPTLDTNNDGRVDDTIDTDSDGIPDSADLQDALFGGLGLPAALSGLDTDGDGIRDIEDLDDDNDGILDSIEGSEDADGDGIINRLDLDSDNDGINDVREGGLIDADFNEVIDGPDNDNDGMADGTDSDNDGLLSTVDPDDGGVAATVPDSDGDGTPDFLDLDSDNDSVSDLVEGGHPGLIDADNNGVVDGPDSDGDGIVDSADGNDSLFGDSGDPLPADTDSDGYYYDYRDLDSDDDGTPDITQLGLAALDTDGDGQIDTRDDADGDGIIDSADSDDAVFGGLSSSNQFPSFTGDATLAAVNEDTTDPAGETITNLFNGLFSDPDAGASLGGLAIVGNTANATTEGAWQYSTDGTSWFDVSTVADDATALVLSAATEVRFVPAADYNGTPPALTVRALDDTYAGGFTAGGTRVAVDTSTNGGGSAIAAAINTLSTSIIPVNDAPSFTVGANQTVNDSDGAQTVTGFATDISAGPADESGQTIRFVVGNTDNSLFAAQPEIDAAGNLTYTPAVGANGTANVFVTSEDNGREDNGGEDTSSLQIFTIEVSDTTAPVPTLTLNDITADNILNATEAGSPVSITGAVAGDYTPGDTVTLTVNGNSVTGTVDAAGAFSIDVPGSDLSTDGDTTIDASITTTDAAGNPGTVTATKTYSVDTTAPVPTLTLNDITADNVLNAVESGSPVSVTGAVAGDYTPGDTVTLTVNGNSV